MIKTFNQFLLEGRTVKYFSGETEVHHPWPMKNKEFEQKFPGVKGRKSDSFSKFVAHDMNKNILPITRTVFYKTDNPSLHKCGSKCLNAKGPNCECACGGKNHGKGYHG